MTQASSFLPRTSRLGYAIRGLALAAGIAALFFGYRHILQLSAPTRPLSGAELEQERIRKSLEADRESLSKPDVSDAEIYGALIRLSQRQDRRAHDVAIRRAGDASVQVREAAADGIGYFSDSAAQETLGKLLKDPELRVRVAAIHGAGHLQAPARVTILKEVLGSSGATGQERAAAFQSLLTASANPAEQASAIEDLAKAAIQAVDADTAIRAATAAVAFAPRDPKVAAMLRHILEQGNRPAVSVVAVRHLAAIGNPWYRENAHRFVKDPDPQVRIAAIQSLGFACPRDRFALLGEALRSRGEPALAAAALDQLAHTPGPEARKVLQSAAGSLAHADPEKARAFQSALVDQKGQPGPDPCTARNGG